MNVRTFSLLFVLLLLTVNSVRAESAEIYRSFFNKYAVGGYDTVAYFNQSEALKGKKELNFDYKGATWLFSSEENKQLFITDPIKYSPQYGGYCAYAVAKNDLVSADPEAWRIENSKLYLNYNKDIQKTWEADKINFIELANKNWPTIRK